MPRIAYVIVCVLFAGCAGMTEEVSGPTPTSNWTPPANRNELQVKRDRAECQRRGISSADVCLQALGYSKQ
jgi:hypothetical protein